MPDVWTPPQGPAELHMAPLSEHDMAYKTPPNEQAVTYKAPLSERVKFESGAMATNCRDEQKSCAERAVGSNSLRTLQCADQVPRSCLISSWSLKDTRVFSPRLCLMKSNGTEVIILS